ncbi:MAG TPA: cytochrome c3 family protein [bacterium]
MLCFALLLLIVSAFAFYWNTDKNGHEQPIAFSHRKHVSELGIDCAFCHLYPDKSPRAEVPPVQKCIDCHAFIATEKPEIKKLLGYWERKESVPWVKIYFMPDHVYFSHKRHVLKGIDCSVCHGDVKTMEKIIKVYSLNMGWCVSCHRSKNAPLDCYTCHK